MRLSDFEVMSFDCYGTLIDWESGIIQALAPLLRRAGVDLSAGGEVSSGGVSRAGMGLSRGDTALTRDSVLEAFARLESRQQEKAPEMLYPAVLAAVHTQLAEEWAVAPDAAEASAFGASIGAWPAFPDTVAALQSLQRHVRLVILSNVDRASFQATAARLGVTFDAVYTAQDIGSYKPDQANFRYLIERLRERGGAQDKILHVAQSLFHDHVPAQALGLASAWIDRRHEAGGAGATAPVVGQVRYDVRFASLAELAQAVAAERG